MELISYIGILKETLTKKLSVLQAYIEATERQARIAESDDFDLEAFESNMEQKDALLDQVNELDEGFDRVFRQIRVDLQAHKDEYKKEIQELQELIRKCTDLGVEIQTKEERNRQRLEQVFSSQQRSIRQVKANSKSVSNYYKAMNPGKNMDSYFMDQKK